PARPRWRPPPRRPRRGARAGRALCPRGGVCYSRGAPAPGRNPMKILVERLTTSPTEHRFGPDDPGWLEVQEVVPELAGALAEVPSATVRVQRMGLDVFLEGALEGALELACSRCLARYRQPLREPFRLVLEPAGARVPSEPEAARDLSRLGMCLGDELEMGWFHGPEIDLRALLREVVALA